MIYAILVVVGIITGVTAGLFGFDQISSDGAALEEAVVARLADDGTPEDLTHALDRLMSRMESEWGAPRMKYRQSA